MHFQGSPNTSNLKTRIGRGIASTKGDVFTNSLRNECKLDDLDLLLSQVLPNVISMSKQEHIIDEFLEQCDFINGNLTICCSTCYRQGDKCISMNNKEHMVNEVQDLYEPHHTKDVSEQVFLVTGEQFHTPNQEDQGMYYSITLER